VLYFTIDELGYYESSHMRHPALQTRDGDRLAAQGPRCTQRLAGGNVCVPTQGAVRTGKHTGHATIHHNGGFDLLFGCYDPDPAHTCFPRCLIRNSQEVPLEGNTGNLLHGKTCRQYRIREESQQFLRDNKDRPFLACLAWTPSHGRFGLPEDGPSFLLYKNKPWPHDLKVYAAMVHRVDRPLGEIRDLLTEPGIAHKTPIMFTGDKGGNAYLADQQHPRGFMGPNASLKAGVACRAGQGRFFEGGLRVPAIAHWPGRISAGVSNHLGSFPDLLRTFAEPAGAEVPRISTAFRWCGICWARQVPAASSRNTGASTGRTATAPPSA